MLRGWLIYQEQDAKENHSYIQWFIEEARKVNIDLHLILREKLVIGVLNHTNQILYQQNQTKLPDFAIVRTREPLLNSHLEALGIAVFNSFKVSLICNNKAFTHHYIQQLQVAMPDTIYYEKNTKPVTPPLPFPFVLKEVGGRGGKQVYFIRHDDDWKEIKNSIRSDFILQSTNGIQLGKDIRVFVVGKKIIGAVLRESKTDFRANYKLGGEASWYELNDQEKSIVYKIIKAFDFGMVGIDFFLDRQGQLLFNEIEDVVGSRTLSAVSNVNILEEYVTYIKEKMEQNFS